MGPDDKNTGSRLVSELQTTTPRSFLLSPMTARFSVLKNVLSGRFNARADFCVARCPLSPSQLVFVPSMAISQDDRMPSFWFLSRGGFAQKLLLVLGSLLEMVLAGCRREPESWDRRIG